MTKFSTSNNVVITASQIKTHQYSATHFERDLSSGPADHTAAGVQVMHGMAGIPGAFFNFEISPILVIHQETRQSFAHFLTSCVPSPRLLSAALTGAFWSEPVRLLEES